METAEPSTPAMVLPRAAATHRYVLLGMLTLVGTFNIFDKALFQVLADPIKRDFALSDTQVGLLGGLTFGLFYSIGGIPFGMIADRFNRRMVISACLAFWSAATVACGLATNFIMLVSVRSLVGAGEAGSGPSAMSMISDLFQRHERARATAVYNLAIPIGSGLSLTVGGYLVHALGWRQTLLTAGVAGIVVALLVLLVVREPIRRRGDGERDTGPAPALARTFRFVLSQPALLHVAAAITLVQIALNGYGMWMHVFFTRAHGLLPATAGLQVTIAILPASALSMVACAAIADRLAKSEARWWVWAPAIVTAFALPASFLAVTAPTALGGLIWTGVWMFAASAWYGVGYGVAQSLVAPRMRATLMAMLLILANMVGYGLGPVVAGAISDFMAPTAGDRSIAYGMVGTNILAAWAALHFFLAARSLRADLARAAAAS